MCPHPIQSHTDYTASTVRTEATDECGVSRVHHHHINQPPPPIIADDDDDDCDDDDGEVESAQLV